MLDNYIQGTTTKLTNTQTVKPTGTPKLVGKTYTTTHPRQNHNKQRMARFINMCHQLIILQVKLH